MKSLGTRILLIVAGGSLALAITLALIAGMSFRGYFVEVQATRAHNFAERILANEPEFWETYLRSPGFFSERLQPLLTYEPNTGLFVIGEDGRVLATASEGKIFWAGNYRVDMAALRLAATSPPGAAIVGSDPDYIDSRCVIAVRPIFYQGQSVAWLYVVARNADSSPELPGLVRSYAVRGAIKIALITLALGLLVTVGVLTLVAKPMAALTEAAERVQSDGEQGSGPFPQTDRPDEIGRMARAFEAMVGRLKDKTRSLEQTDASRRAMIAGVSHDLRTPLTALTSQLETLRLKRETLNTNDSERYMDGALNNALHLRRLTDSLVDLAKLDNPDLVATLEPISLGDLLEDIGVRHHAVAEGLKVKLKVDYPDRLPLTRADIQLLERALNNLIDNALRVTPAGGQVTLSAAPFEEKIRVAVADTGSGISAEDLQRVFEPFYQTSKHRENRGSAGLGLAIVQRVAQLHNSPVGIDSQLGKGTSIWLDLKRA
jgi:two-component system, OmpR family, sensor kinase